MKNTKLGFAIVPILVIAGLITLGGYILTKTTSLFNRDSHNAAKGKETTTELVAAGNSLGAAQTASAQVIGEAATDLPESPNRDFILNEVPVMLARGPAPDPRQIIAARDRKIAFLQGNLSAQKELTVRALGDAASLRTTLATTTAAKQSADEQLTIAAAEKLAANRASYGLAAGFVAAVAAFLWLRSWMHGNTVGLDAVAEARALIMKGEKDVENAFDGIVDRKNWTKVANLVDSHFKASDLTPKA